jgi:hypothetical protein
MTKPRTTIEFLDTLKACHHIESDYALAKLLGTSRSVISKYRSEKDTFGEEMAIKIAELLELPPGYVVACAHAERTKRPEIKRLWREMAKTLAPMFAAGIIGSGALLTPPPSAASELAGNIHYTKRRRWPKIPNLAGQDRRSPHGRPRTIPRQFRLLPILHRLHA